MIAADAAADGVKHLDVGFGEDFAAIHAGHNRPFRKRPQQYKHREFGVKVHGTFDADFGEKLSGIATLWGSCQLVRPQAPDQFGVERWLA